MWKHHEGGRGHKAMYRSKHDKKKEIRYMITTALRGLPVRHTIFCSLSRLYFLHTHFVEDSKHIQRPPCRLLKDSRTWPFAVLRKILCRSSARSSLSSLFSARPSCHSPSPPPAPAKPYACAWFQRPPQRCLRAVVQSIRKRTWD